MLALIFCALSASAHDIEKRDYFETECARYLILEVPDFLERESREDMEHLLLGLKGRIQLYAHPLDRVMVKLIEHELMTRDIVGSRSNGDAE